MIPAVAPPSEAELSSQLRRMAAAGVSVRDLVEHLRRVFPGPDVSFAVVLAFKRAFHLPLLEARRIEGSALLGGTLYTPEQTEALFRPLIDRDRDSWDV